jgi:rhodanese-related sulfurtransferase
MKKDYIIFLFLLLGLNSYGQDYSSFEVLKNEIIYKTVPLISVEKLKQVEKTKSPLLIIDAREKEEYNVSHIKGAKYVGYDNFKASTLKEIDKETTIVVYCSVGYRSEKVGEKLKRIGFSKVMNLQGGIFDWVNSGYPVYDNNGKETKKIHAYDKSWGKWLTKGEKVYE